MVFAYIANVIFGRLDGGGALATTANPGEAIPGRPYASKLARATAVSPFVRAGNVHLPTGHAASMAADISWDPASFPIECARFPNARHDDQVDGMLWVRAQRGARVPAYDPTMPDDVTLTVLVSPRCASASAPTDASSACPAVPGRRTCGRSCQSRSDGPLRHAACAMPSTTPGRTTGRRSPTATVSRSSCRCPEVDGTRPRHLGQAWTRSFKPCSAAGPITHARTVTPA